MTQSQYLRTNYTYKLSDGSFTNSNSAPGYRMPTSRKEMIYIPKFHCKNCKMALNLIEKVANPVGKPESRKRKRSEDTTSGSGSQHIGLPQQTRPRSNSGQDRPRDPDSHRNQPNFQYTASTANTGRITGHSPQLLLSTSTADAGMLVPSPAAGCPVSSTVHQPDPEEAEVSAASAADFAAASGTGARPRGEPVRGSRDLRTPPTLFKMSGCKRINDNCQL
jgi:hypothetical protein